MSIINNAKEIADLVKKLGDIELYRKIVELEGEIIELTREKNALTEKNQELIMALKISSDMVFKSPFYYLLDDPVPYCPKCWEVDRTAVHLINNDTMEGQKQFICPNCSTKAWE